MKAFFKKLWEYLKKKFWYLLLLVASSSYVLHYRNQIYQLKEINAQNLIFLLWLVLLFFPLFSEMEFLGVKVKKEVEKATEEVKESIGALQTQLNQIQMTTSIATNLNINNSPLPPEQKIEELLQIVRDLRLSQSNPSSIISDAVITKDDHDVYLFKVRRDIELSLRELCEKIGYANMASIPKMLQVLNHAEVINGTTCDLINQISKIANRAIHGEIVSSDYIAFVQETNPVVIRQLKEASSRLVHITCPRCKYTGYSTNENVCPRCGYFHDDE